MGRMVSPEVRPLVRAAIAQGWELDDSGKRHPKLRGPDGHVITVPGSLSDWRGVKNLRAQLRRAGVEV